MNSNGNASNINASNASGVLPDFDIIIKRLLTVYNRERRRCPSNMVNTKHDATSYENCSYKHEIKIYDANILYEGFLRQKRVSGWKPQTQRFQMNLLSNLSKLQKEIRNKTLKIPEGNEFVLRERGKVRFVTGEKTIGAIAKSVLCDHELWPKLRRYLIYDNSASLIGRGTSHARKRLDVHLRKFYQKNGSNDGYILLVDFVKYFDNIRHDLFLELLDSLGIKEEYAVWLLTYIVSLSRVDVSYMDEEEYTNCLNVVFNSLEYQHIDKALLTGKKFMDKHFNIGCPVAQVAGVVYPVPFDNFIKIVKGMKYYGRYMDDSYIIHKDKNYLESLLLEITEVANNLGITIHPKKTRIVKLSSYWRFMQVQYALTDTGRIIKKINPKRLTDMRRKIKKLAGVIPLERFDNLYKSWFRNHYKIMSRKQRDNMDELYHSLREVYFSESKEGLDV